TSTSFTSSLRIRHPFASAPASPYNNYLVQVAQRPHARQSLAGLPALTSQVLCTMNNGESLRRSLPLRPLMGTGASNSLDRSGPDRETVRALIFEALLPCHFFVAQSFELKVQHLPAEESAWEIFHGRLLDASQTREKQTFESWNVFFRGPEGQPVE